MYVKTKKKRRHVDQKSLLLFCVWVLNPHNFHGQRKLLNERLHDTGSLCQNHQRQMQMLELRNCLLKLLHYMVMHKLHQKLLKLHFLKFWFYIIIKGH